jgi:hypothetical protein
MIMQFKDFKKEVARFGYTVRAKETSFHSLGYGIKKFISFYKDGKKIEFGMGSKEYWEKFDIDFPMIRKWQSEITVMDGEQKMIFN